MAPGTLKRGDTLAAISPSWGGAGGSEDSLRILNHINMDMIKENPKILLVFSDSIITHCVCLKAGLGSFYGPALFDGICRECGNAPVPD